MGAQIVSDWTLPAALDAVAACKFCTGHMLQAITPQVQGLLQVKAWDWRITITDLHSCQHIQSIHCQPATVKTLYVSYHLHDVHAELHRHRKRGTLSCYFATHVLYKIAMLNPAQETIKHSTQCTRTSPVVHHTNSSFHFVNSQLAATNLCTEAATAHQPKLSAQLTTLVCFMNMSANMQRLLSEACMHAVVSPKHVWPQLLNSILMQTCCPTPYMLPHTT